MINQEILNQHKKLERYRGSEHSKLNKFKKSHYKNE